MIGEILDGKYRIDRELGAGGMGHVYLATHLGTTRVVAAKVISPKWASDPHFLARFQREAQACGRLRHPNIVNVTDFGIASTRKGRIPYLVMELLDGQTLSAFQQNTPKPPLTLVADILDQVALALDDAHRHGIVHRDLKPDNIWLEPNGRGGYTIKVLDFGVAKMKLPGELQAPDPAPAIPTGPSPLPASETLAAPEGGTIAMSGGFDSGTAADAATVVFDTLRESRPGSSGAGLTTSPDSETIAMAQVPSDPSSGSYGSDGGHTMPGSLVGTPAYMSPEQSLGGEVDFRSDIYSMAVVAYTLVCGELPFSGKTRDLVAYHRTGTPRAPALVTKVPRDVSDTVLAGLARDPAARPSSAAEFARRFHNSVDAEFFAFRRSRQFAFRHIPQFFVLIVVIYGTLEAAISILASILGKPDSRAIGPVALLALLGALLMVFSDNVLRATAALIALDEKVRVRRMVAFRVLWRLIKALPKLIRTQLQSLIAFGPGWVTRDCLWPVLCVVENLSGREAIARSRRLMEGLNSVGRALAIRHLALAAMALVDLAQFLDATPHSVGKHTFRTNSANWFPIFAIFAAAPLFLYDRTAAHKDGPLLQLDRTPDVRVTARLLSWSSIIWLTAGICYVLYLFYKPFKALIGMG
jgi:serine/threonine protein kinase